MSSLPSTTTSLPVIDHTPTPIAPILDTSLRHLLPHLALGFVPQQTNSNGLLCALYALEGSLHAARELHESGTGDEIIHVTMNDMLSILYGEGKITVEMLENGALLEDLDLVVTDVHGDDFGATQDDLEDKYAMAISPFTSLSKTGMTRTPAGQLFANLRPHRKDDRLWCGIPWDDDVTDERNLPIKHCLLVEADDNVEVFRNSRALVLATTAATGEDEIDIHKGELLYDLKIGESEGCWIGTNFRGQRGEFLASKTRLVSGGLGQRYLCALEKKLRDSEGHHEETIETLRLSYLDTENLGVGQIWLILQAINAELGLSYCLGYITEGFRGEYVKPQHIIDWEREIQAANKNFVNIPWKAEVNVWHGERVRHTVAAILPFSDDTKKGPVVWIHNNGMGPKMLAHTGREGMAHWSKLTQEDSAEGRAMVAAWDLESLILPILVEDAVHQAFRILFDYSIGPSTLKQGHFVYVANSKEEGGESGKMVDGLKFLWVESCDKAISGWIDAGYLEPVARVLNGGVAISPPQPPAIESGMAVEANPPATQVDNTIINKDSPAPTATTTTTPPSQLPPSLRIYRTVSSLPHPPQKHDILLELTTNGRYPSLLPFATGSDPRTFTHRSIRAVEKPWDLPSSLPMQHATKGVRFPLSAVKYEKEVVLCLGKRDGKTGPFLVRNLEGKIWAVRQCDLEVEKDAWGLRVEKTWLERLLVGLRPDVGEEVETLLVGKKRTRGEEKEVDGERKVKKGGKVASAKKRGNRK